MRFTRELILVSVVLVAAVACLHIWQLRRPSQVRGIVVDISTGRPIAGVRVRPKFLNGHGQGVLTDNRGRFTMPVPAADGIQGMFVDDPHYAGLFGNVVGRESHPFRKGEQDSGVIVPAIPAVELSGKVLDDRNHPISGCEIELLRPLSLHGPLQLVAANRPAQHTQQDGAYRFTQLGAGIYYLLAECNGPSRMAYLLTTEESTAPKEQKVWANLLYPHANKLSDARPVVAMPGQRISGLDFRLTRTRGFLLKGRFIWADGNGPQQLDVYSNDFSLTPLDLGLAENQTESRCGWNTYPGRFECSQITPGRYRLLMKIAPIWIEADRGRPQRQNDQVGKMELDLTDKAAGSLALDMHRSDRSAADTTPKTPTDTGWLVLQLTGCGSHEFPFMCLKIWDENGMGAPALTYPGRGKHAGQTELPAGHYRITATCRAYWGLHGYSYFDEVLAEKGFPTEVLAGRITKLRIHALSTEEMYQAAIAHLRTQSSPNN